MHLGKEDCSAPLLCPQLSPVSLGTTMQKLSASLSSLPHCTDTASTRVLTASGASAGAVAAAAAGRSQSCAGEGTASAPGTP